MLAERPPALSKAPTGIQGLDEITGGGLPAGRPTLICGTAGCGKTMLAMEFLVRGATQFGEPGVFMMFEENATELSANVRSLGFDLEKLAAQKMILLDYVRIERSEIEETGEYNLDGLSSGSGTQSIPSAPSAWCSTRSRRSSPGYQITPSCAPNCAGCFVG